MKWLAEKIKYSEKLKKKWKTVNNYITFTANKWLKQWNVSQRQTNGRQKWKIKQIHISCESNSSHVAVGPTVVPLVDDWGPEEGGTVDKTLCVLLFWKLSPKLCEWFALCLWLLLTSFLSFSLRLAFFFFLSRTATSCFISIYVFLSSWRRSCNIFIRLSASIDLSSGRQKLYLDSGTKFSNDTGVDRNGIRCSSAVNGDWRSALVRPEEPLVLHPILSLG